MLDLEYQELLTYPQD